MDSFEGVVLLSSEPRKCKDYDGSEKQKKAVCKYQNGDIAEAPILEAHGEKDSQSDEPCKGAGSRTGVHAAKLEDFGQNSTEPKWYALGCCGEDLAEDVDNVVLTHSYSNKQVPRSRAGDDPNIRV